jgi:hypothetical protein
MKRYILNSAVITSPGIYRYALIDSESARKWLAKGPFESTIGYEETAEALSQLLGTPIAVNRKTIVMRDGDEALVFRLVLPPGSPRIDPRDKGQIAQHVEAGHWELGLLVKSSFADAFELLWHFKKAVQRYSKATERDLRFLEETRNMPIVIGSKEELSRLKSIKRLFPEYFKSTGGESADYTDDAELLREGDIIVRGESIPDAFIRATAFPKSFSL